MKKFSQIVKVAVGTTIALLLSVGIFNVKAQAQVYPLSNGTIFDSDFYANLYPDVRAAYANGQYPDRLLYHYLTYGIKEGRIPSAYSMTKVTAVKGVTYYQTPVTQVGNVVYPAGYYCVVPTQYVYPNGINCVFSQCYAIPSTQIAGTISPVGYCSIAPYK